MVPFRHRKSTIFLIFEKKTKNHYHIFQNNAAVCWIL